MSSSKPPPVVWEGIELGGQHFRLVGFDDEELVIEVRTGEGYLRVAFAPDPEELQQHRLKGPPGTILLDKMSTAFARRCLAIYAADKSLKWGSKPPNTSHTKPQRE